MLFNIAVVGATGLVGRELINTLYDRKFPIDKLVPFASKKSYGKSVSFGPIKTYKVQIIEQYNDFSDIDIAFFVTNDSATKEHINKFIDSGCIVIDNSSIFRLSPNVPLIIPEINSHDIKNHKLISNPNCSTIQLLMSIMPIKKVIDINKVFVSTYQSVSGLGAKAMNELYEKTKQSYAFLDNDDKNDSEQNISAFPKDIVFNCIPQVGKIDPISGFSEEENKIFLESNKILGQNININASCVRVPVFIGHGQSIFIDFKTELNNLDLVLEEYDNFKGVELFEDLDSYATQTITRNTDDVIVSRLRLNEDKLSCSMWSVTDNLKKGAALNAVQIAEIMVNK